MATTKGRKIKEIVRERYAEVASGTGCECAETPLYTADEVQGLPDGGIGRIGGVRQSYGVGLAQTGRDGRRLWQRRRHRLLPGGQGRWTPGQGDWHRHDA